MTESRHAREDHKRRRKAIEEMGIGEVVATTVKYDSKRKRYYYYEVSTNAILTVKAMDADIVITRMIARPGRLKAYFDNLPQEVWDKAIAHAKAKMYY